MSFKTIGMTKTIKTMSDKKKIRSKFREAVFTRDKNKCRICGRSDVKLDAHHIVPRDFLKDGGYFLDNGITLCDSDDKNSCHIKAEDYYSSGSCEKGFSPRELAELVNSSIEKINAYLK